MNSFRNVQRAIAFEIDRQIRLTADGDRVIQETRLWDEANQRTYSMRGKEEAHDYRYFPDPDLVPLRIDEAWIDRVREELPELPDEKRTRFIAQYQIRPYDAGVLTGSRALADYFEACAQRFPDAKKVCNWITGDLLREMNQAGLSMEACPIRPATLATMLSLLEEGKISRRIAQQVFEEMFRTGERPEEILERKGWATVSDRDSLIQVVERVMEENPKEVAGYRAGKTKLMGFFMGQIMRLTQGQADHKLAQEILEERLTTG
jgi:aspartyl-tRNA(Asn)/glutamyl-tRNA(Gln) amidotransferase subunit B